MSKEQRQKLKTLKQRASTGDLRVAVSDKEGEFTVRPKSLESKIVKRHLSVTTKGILNTAKPR